eukprot:TRINITY_DN1428_c0_g1_i3.p1 TRINITY_DN1428_c0_g1~~TRINITY_DN1428_c0_g1_i3.p1  ORF type:complete len:128 (+),score=23.76 TRINITY_DN1428_c0_g1_i3:165-548(+)
MQHSWGASLKEAWESVTIAMFNYMVEVDNVETTSERSIEIEGHDLDSLLYNYLDEWLFVFSTEYFVCKEVKITEFDREAFKIKCVGKGERLDKKKHQTGTEIKAITYSCMKIVEEQNKSDIWVIVDI